MAEARCQLAGNKGERRTSGSWLGVLERARGRTRERYLTDTSLKRGGGAGATQRNLLVHAYLDIDHERAWDKLTDRPQAVAAERSSKPAAARRTSFLSVFSHVKSWSSRPKWP